MASCGELWTVSRWNEHVCGMKMDVAAGHMYFYFFMKLWVGGMEQRCYAFKDKSNRDREKCACV